MQLPLMPLKTPPCYCPVPNRTPTVVNFTLVAASTSRTAPEVSLTAVPAFPWAPFVVSPR